MLAVQEASWAEKQPWHRLRRYAEKAQRKSGQLSSWSWSRVVLVFVVVGRQSRLESFSMVVFLRGGSDKERSVVVVVVIVCGVRLRRRGSAMPFVKIYRKWHSSEKA